MKRNIREIEDNVYKEFIQDLLTNYPKFKEDQYKFEPTDSLAYDETYRNKYLRLQNTIRLSSSLRENTNIYRKKPKMENKLKSVINKIIREELTELGPKAIRSTAKHLGKDTMHDIAKGVLTSDDFDQIYDELIYDIGIDPEAAHEVLTLLSQRFKDINLNEKKEPKKNKKEEEELDLDLDLDTPPADNSLDLGAPAPDTSMDVNMDLGSSGDANQKSISKGLQMALDAAKQMPDSETKDKLVRQIGNTALFFLKTQIPGEKQI
jgi:hypothetical protein